MKEVGVGAMRNEAESIEGRQGLPRAARPGDRPGVRPEAESGATPSGDCVWSVSEAAGYLQIPVSSIYKMTGRKAAVRIPHIRIGGKLRFRRADIDRWLTLLTVSNIDTLSKMHKKISKVIHGNHPQTPASQW